VIKDTWFRNLNVFLKNDRYTPPIISELLFNHPVYALYLNTELPTLPDCETEVQKTIQDEQRIGWKQLLHGRLSIRWGSVIGRHLAANHVAAIEMTINRWDQTIIKMIFQLFLDIWNSRNNEGHYLTARNESQLSGEQTLNKIIELQESNQEVRSCD
jgi:hypothetical protein